jgi:hypothetical protein
MTSRHNGRRYRYGISLALVIGFLASFGLLPSSAAPAYPQHVEVAANGALVFQNRTGGNIAGLELIFDEPAGGGAMSISAFSGFEPAKVIRCANCVFISVTLSDGESLRVTLNSPYEASRIVAAYWHMDLRSVFQAIWKVTRCSVL